MQFDGLIREFSAAHLLGWICIRVTCQKETSSEETGSTLGNHKVLWTWAKGMSVCIEEVNSKNRGISIREIAGKWLIQIIENQPDQTRRNRPLSEYEAIGTPLRAMERYRNNQEGLYLKDGRCWTSNTNFFEKRRTLTSFQWNPA